MDGTGAAVASHSFTPFCIKLELTYQSPHLPSFLLFASAWRIIFRGGKRNPNGVYEGGRIRGVLSVDAC